MRPASSRSRAAALVCFGALRLLVSADVPVPWTHSWNSAGDMLWVDFAGQGYRLFPTAEQTAFIASTYQIISLEKCFASTAYPYTEDAQTAFASELKALNASVRVLMYFHVTMDVSTCYRSGVEFVAHPEWWARNDSGGAYWTGRWWYHNHSRRDVQAFWAGAIANTTTPNGSTGGLASNTLFDGAFVDGSGTPSYADMSLARTASLAAGTLAALNATRALFAAGQLLIGNGLMTGGDNGTFPDAVVDGYCFEHFLAFEMIDGGNGSLIPAAFEQARDLIAAAAAAGKVVLVKGWPGPVITPVTALGPSWPGGGQPTTHEGLAAAAAAALVPSLAGFLIVAAPAVYFSYGWWYTIVDGVTPCPSDPTSCSAPTGWYPEFGRPLGPPLGPAVRVSGSATGWLYTREFAFASVVFDAANWTNGSVITWRSESATATSSGSATSSPTGTPSQTASSAVTPTGSATPSATQVASASSAATKSGSLTSSRLAPAASATASTSSLPPDDAAAAGSSGSGGPSALVLAAALSPVAVCVTGVGLAVLAWAYCPACRRRLQVSLRCSSQCCSLPAGKSGQGPLTTRSQGRPTVVSWGLPAAEARAGGGPASAPAVLSQGQGQGQGQGAQLSAPGSGCAPLSTQNPIGIASSRYE